MISIDFIVPKNKVLSSNVPRKHIVSWSIGMPLRNMSALKGLEYHPENVRDVAREKYELILQKRQVRSAKSKLKKSLKKSGFPDVKINEILEKEFPVLPSEKDFDIPYLIPHRACLLVNVRIPTGQSFDPPNYWPTVKYLQDGLTDASWWIDDNLHTIPLTCFSGGEKSDIPDSYIFTLSFFPFKDFENFDIELSNLGDTLRGVYG